MQWKKWPMYKVIGHRSIPLENDQYHWLMKYQILFWSWSSGWKIDNILAQVIITEHNLSILWKWICYTVFCCINRHLHITLTHSLSHFHSFFSICLERWFLIRKCHSVRDYIKSFELHVIKIVLKTTGFHSENRLLWLSSFTFVVSLFKA